MRGKQWATDVVVVDVDVAVVDGLSDALMNIRQQSELETLIG